MPPKPTKVTRGSASQKQGQCIDSLATAPSPPKVRKTKKSPKKQASFESPEVMKITPQVVTLLKKNQVSSSDESSNDGNSTGDENVSVTMASNLPTNAVFDPKFEHLLTYYFMAHGDQHDIQQAFCSKSNRRF